MNKQELVESIAKDAGITKTAAMAALDSLIAGATRALRKGVPVTLVGFGTFRTVVRNARVARNPRTGVAIRVPKRRVVRFTVGKALKDAVR